MLINVPQSPQGSDSGPKDLMTSIDPFPHGQSDKPKKSITSCQDLIYFDDEEDDLLEGEASIDY